MVQRAGLFTYDDILNDVLYSITRDNRGTGLEMVQIKSGPGTAMAQPICTRPAVGLFADLDARTDIKLINGARAWMTDRGTWGSTWIVVGATAAAAGSWFPEGPIRGNGTPEGVVTAPIGSVFQRLDGGALTATYTKESGTGNTGWVAK